MTTEFETQLLQHLQNQALQLTAISRQQAEQATAIGAILKALQKEPSGESLESTLKSALQPLQSNLEMLVTSFNSLSSVSQTLSAQLPPPSKP